MITGEARRKFISSGCNMCCMGTGAADCNQLIDMRVNAPYVSSKLYNFYLECLSESKIIVIQNECDLRVKEAQSSVVGPSADATTTYVEYIAEQLILPRCPALHCTKWVPDFDACSALQCGSLSTTPEGNIITSNGCGTYFCAWCLTICSDKSACHSHVATCNFNPAEDKSLFPAQPHPETWNTVMQEAARARVKKYIANVQRFPCLPSCSPFRTCLIPLQEVPAPLRARTYNLVRTRFPEIRLQPFGVLVTDGYRPAVGRASPQPYLEENVTALMEMGIADRPRALQVLQGNRNNIEIAINILLALQPNPKP